MSARDNLDTTVHTVGRNARTAAAGISNTDTVLRRSGISLRPTTAEVGGRATIAGTSVQTGSNVSTARAVTSRAAVATRESIAEATERLEQTASLNKSCQEQYNDCMDQFCAVIDSNQKRCSCSANLSRYTRVESAVKDANNQLNDVAQRIRYVGLSADEIRAIMSATEAEETLAGTRDTSETRSMLDDIADLIKNPSSSSSSSTDNMFSTLDLNLDFSDTSDMFNLDFLNNNSSNLSNMRGTELYNAAKKRCNSILTQCTDAGATSQQITANYDLAIDRDCIAYEQGLNKMNETLLTNVRSANLMLQKARLAVLQNKNQYDAKECIGALDTCMTDDMVCGADYNKCLDPTKRYIDENGAVIMGQNVTNIRDMMAEFNNADINREFLMASNSATNTSTRGELIVKYLLQKIGTGRRTTDGGLCRPVLDKCQRYTYNASGNYEQYNDIVVNYIQRAMVNIKASQEKIISDYAANCMTDVSKCYNQQVTQVNSWTSAARVDSIQRVMRGACRNIALTCGYAILEKGDGKDYTDDTDYDTIIDTVSQIFYQSMLCPDHSSYMPAGYDVNPSGYVNKLCKCDDGYVPAAGACLLESMCGENMTYNTAGQCVCKDGYTLSNGACVAMCLNETCTDNAHKLTRTTTVSPNGTAGGNVTTCCACDDGFASWSGACVPKCDNGYNADGSCKPAQNMCLTYGVAIADNSCTSVTGNCVAVGCACAPGATLRADGKCYGESSDNQSPGFSGRCPEHAEYKPSECPYIQPDTYCVEQYCKCEDTYVVSGSRCVQPPTIVCAETDAHSMYDPNCTTPTSGLQGCIGNQCRCNAGFRSTGSQCVQLLNQ